MTILKMEDYQLYEVHLNALINLISILPRDKLLGFVQIGSSDEYGDSIAPQFEDQIEFPFLHTLIQNLLNYTFTIFK